MSAFSPEEQKLLVQAEYGEFLRGKIKLAPKKGFDVPLDQINPHLKPHTRDIVRWALAGGQRAIFASFGLHKTATNLEVMRQIGVHRAGVRRLIIMPLGVRQEFAREVRQRFTGDQAVELKFIKSSAEVDRDDVIYVTNYEPIRDGKIDPKLFGAVALDEAAVLRSYTNPGEMVFDPFCGLGTVPVRAMKLGRRGGGSELNTGYFRDQVHNCQLMEREVSMPTLFDLAALDEENEK